MIKLIKYDKILTWLKFGSKIFTSAHTRAPNVYSNLHRILYDFNSACLIDALILLIIEERNVMGRKP